MEIKIEVVGAMLEFMQQRVRYKVAYGGRGSGKSHTIARMLLVLALQKKQRVLNVRYVQQSIRESVYQLYVDLIHQYQLTPHFTIKNDRIQAFNGSDFIFKGIQNELAQSIKSLEGVDICWVEEAQMLTAECWDLLIPTIRKNDSEIWISFNPCYASDAVYQKFLVGEKPANALVKKIGYQDNPWFPACLYDELLWDKEHSLQRYRHIWEGELKTATDRAAFAHINVGHFDAIEGMNCFIDPSYGGQDKTGITFGYWQEGKAYAWIYEEEGNFAYTYPAILTRLEARGVRCITLETNGDKGILAMMIKQWLQTTNLFLKIDSHYSTQNKNEKIWRCLRAIESVLTLNANSDYECVLQWHEQANHDDGIDSLAMWSALKIKY